MRFVSITLQTRGGDGAADRAGAGRGGQVADEAGQPVEIRVGERELVGAVRMTDRAGAVLGTQKEIFVAVGGRLAATVELAETWREGLDEALGELQRSASRLEMLTGDASAAAGRFAGATCAPG